MVCSALSPKKQQGRADPLNVGYKVLTGDVALRVRERVRQTCELFESKILQGW